MLSQVVNDVQNPALGASILWVFATGFSEVSEDKSVPLPVLFMVLPIVLQPISRGMMKSTQEASGLLAFAGKFRFPPTHLAKRVVDGVEVRFGRDQWFALNERVRDMRSLTQQSLGMSIACGILRLDPSNAGVIPKAHLTDPSKNTSPDIRDMLRVAEKMGKIFARNQVNEIAQALGVSL